MASSLPKYTSIPKAFAANGDKNTIPANDTGTGAASFDKGFPEITAKPLSEGGQPPTREDFNALGNMATNNVSYQQQGGLYTFDTSVSDAIGGYPKGAVLAYTKDNKLDFLISLVNNNTYNFIADSSYIGKYWAYTKDLSKYLPLTGGTLTGDIKCNPSNKVTVLHGNSSLNIVGIDGGDDYTKGGYIRLYGSDVDNEYVGGILIGASNGTNVVTTAKFLQDIIEFNSGSTLDNGAYARLYSNQHANYPGRFTLVATDGTNRKVLTGIPNGALEWDGNDVVCLVEKWSDNNGNWYRKYSDGWVEQGGKTGTGESGSRLITLYKPFANANYNVSVTCLSDGKTINGWGYAYDRTTTNFKMVKTEAEALWRAEGQGVI